MLFFVLLYFVQGIALAYFTGFQKRYLASGGVSPNSIATITVLVLLPFVLKPIIGLILDSLEIQRKIALQTGLLLATISFGAASFLNPTNVLPLFTLTMIFASLGIAIFDTVADALAVDTFQSIEFANLQSAMLIGKSLGLILFSIFFGILIDQINYTIVFPLISITMLLPLFLVKFIKAAPKKERFRWTDFKIFKSGDFLLLSLFGILYSIPSFGISGLISYFLSESGYTALNVGWMESIKSIGAVLGALAFPWFIRKLSFHKFLILFTLAGAIIASIFSIPTITTPFMGIFICIFGIIWALRETFYTTLAMRITKPSIAASMFSILMAFSNFGTSLGEGLATASAGHYGFPKTFLAFAVINLLSLVYLKTKLFKKIKTIS